MSAHHDHEHGHGHGAHGDGHDHGSLKSYAIGFILSVILTAIPFWLVMGHVIKDSSTTAFVILGFAAVQIVVHMVYFLHMNSRSEGGWTLLALIFTIVLVAIVLIVLVAIFIAVIVRTVRRWFGRLVRPSPAS